MVKVYKDGFDRAQELTQAINVIPNTWGLIQNMGLFKNEYKSLKNILVPRYSEDVFLLEDRNWGESAPTVVNGSRDELPLKIPHFPIKDAITPKDIDGVVNFNDIRNGVDLETVASTRLRKMNTIRRTLANTLEFSRAHMLTTGEVWTPSGTLRTSYGSTYNWYNEFGVVRQEMEIMFSDPSVDPKVALDAAADLVDDGFTSNETITQYLVLCSPEFFDALTSHPYVKDAVKYIDFQGLSKEILLGQLSGEGFGARYQVFRFGRMTYIRYSGSIGKTRFIPAGDAYAFPRAEGLFRTFFAPEETFESINKVASEVYWFETMDKRGTMINIEAETNFLNFMSDPASVVRLYKG